MKRVAFLVGAALLGQVCVHAATAGLRMAAPLWALEAGYGKAAVGMLVALFALAQIPLCMAAGRYVDRHGLRRPMAVGILLAVAGAATAAGWPGYAGLCIAALLGGVSMAVVTIAAQRHVGRVVHSPEDLRAAFALVSIAPATANFIGPVLTGVLIDLAGFRWAFASLALLPALAWLLVRRTREVERPAARVQVGGGSAWDLMAGGPMRRLILLNTLMVSTWEFHSFMVPVLGHERGMNASTIGAVLGAFALGAVFVRLAIPALLQRVPEALLIRGALGVSGLLLLAYPFTTAGLTMLACSATLGMALGAVQPSVLSLLHAMTPALRQGEALGLRLLFSNVSQLAVPVLIGVTGGLVSASGAFWAMGSVVALGSRVGLQARSKS